MKKKKNPRYRAIDLFAGIGGIRLGFQQVFGEGLDFVFANEIDPYCCQTYSANFGEDPLGDITKLELTKIPDFDILLGGFPCQSFSIAGEKRGFDDTRGTLFFNIADILRIKQPDAFMLENVKNLKSHDKGRTLHVIKDNLTKDLHYNVHVKVLNAKNFGVPQNRERIFIVGFKKNLKFKFPEPPNTHVKLDDILEKKVDDSFYLSQEYLTGLKRHRARHEAKGNGFGYEVKPRDGIANTIVGGGMGKERNLVKDKILPNCWKKEGDDIQLRNNEGLRKMTPLEWARLQGFPADFVFPVSKTRKYRQLANSVAVPVIEAIALEMRKSLINGEIITNSRNISDELQEGCDLLLKMYDSKAIPKTGVKYIYSINNFIKRNYIRIDILQNTLNLLKKAKILHFKSEKQIQLSSELLNCRDRNIFLEQIDKILSVSINQSNLDKYVKKSVISTVSK